MAARRKTAREKLHELQEAKVVDDPRGRGRMLIPRALDVDALVRRVPRGKLLTVDELRARLAREHGADFACPLVTGIFLRLVAEAAEEERGAGPEEIAPYWRVVRADGSLNEKLPGGADAQAARLREEGHVILPRAGKRVPRVKDCGTALADLS